MSRTTLELYFDHLMRCKKDIENNNFNLMAILGYIVIYSAKG